MKKSIIFIFLLILIPLITADVVSVNSGGSINLTINSDELIEGFFSAIPSETSTTTLNLTLNLNDSSVSTSDAVYISGHVNLSNGTNVTNTAIFLYQNNATLNTTSITTDANGNYNYTFISSSTAGTYEIKVNATYAGLTGEETSTLTVVAPSTPATTDTGGGGGGGGGGGTFTSSLTREGDLTVSPTELSVSIIEGIGETRQLTLRNNGNAAITVYISVEGKEIQDIVTTAARVVLNPNEAETIDVNINATSKELLTGKIVLKYLSYSLEVPVVIGTKSENFLFDASAFLSKESEEMNIGDKLVVQFNLLEVIEVNEKVDVIATYVIKDFEGSIYYEESETFFVEGKKEYTKEFPTENLPEGKYVLGYEISYPGAFAISSLTFNIEDKNFRIVYTAIIVLLITLIILVSYLIVKRKRRLHYGKGI